MEKRKEYIRRAASLLFCLLLTTVMVLGGVFGVGQGKIEVSAAEIATGENAFDGTSVNEDLKDMDLSGYTFNATLNPQVIYFMEYCYAEDVIDCMNYGLYIYVYNPAKLTFSDRAGANTLNMAVEYNAEGKPSGYANVPLKVCGQSTDTLEGLIWKFRVIDDGNKILSNARALEKQTGERRYDVVGVQLWTAGAAGAKEYAVNRVFHYEGYAVGYGTGDKESTLASTITDLESVELDVRHTFYRTATSSKGSGYQNQLDTVYFAVPQRLLDAYGRLQRIKAEWWEYKTKDIIVTSNSAFYNAAIPYIGEDIGGSHNDNIGYSLTEGYSVSTGMGNIQSADWGWNSREYIFVSSSPLGFGVAEALNYLFLVDNIEEYDPYAEDTSSDGVYSNELYDYIMNYDESFDRGTLPIKEGEVSADLFCEDIDDYRKVDSEFGKIQQGYSYYDFDADLDLQHLSSWEESDPSIWDDFREWGLWDTIFGNIPEESSKTVSPIEILEEGDLDGTSTEVSERLLVNKEDVQDLRNFYESAKTIDPLDPEDEECAVVLFRFATTDYYAEPVEIWREGTGIFGADERIDGQAYRAFESVFFNFDVIQLTFSKDGVNTVIPVVSNPLDIVDPLTPPVDMDDDDWWRWILERILIFIGILGGIFLIVALWGPITTLLGLLWKAVCLPFKAISNAVKERKNKNKKE